MSNEQAKAIASLCEARDLAMKNTVAARVPECGDFGAIAQNLDWAINELTAAPIAAGVVPEDLSDAQKQTVECMDSWAIAQSLPSYSQLYSLPEQYSDMLRKICFEYSAGGYNSEGLMLPAVADAKIRWVISDVGRAVAPAHPVAGTASGEAMTADAAQLASLILVDPDGGAMIISSELTHEADGAMRFEVSNPNTGRRFGVYLGLAELKPGAPASPAVATDAPSIPEAGAARDVLAERQRQKDVEGWTPEHDDQYQCDELSLAAACYAMASDVALLLETPNLWPWPENWWKPTTERRNLVKAGALILAEIERLDRLATKEPV